MQASRCSTNFLPVDLSCYLVRSYSRRYATTTRIVRSILLLKFCTQVYITDESHGVSDVSLFPDSLLRACISRSSLLKQLL